MNRGSSEYNRNSDLIEESEAKPAAARVLEEEGGVGGADGLDLGAVSDEARVSSMELDSEAPESARSEEARVRASEDDEDEEEEARVFDERNEKGKAFEYNSLLSEFDEYVANEKSGVSGMSRALSFGFEVGDMVWGKVKSHPWWPGHIFNEAFASPSVRRSRREGYVLVAFFGDSSYGWFDPAELIPFDLYFAEKSRQTNSRNFIKAVEEAVDEMSRRRGLGVVCKCRSAFNFRSTEVQGYFEVDVPDYEPRGVYSVNQIKKARDGFKPSEFLAFVKQLALMPRGGDPKNISFVKNKATVFALRKALFEEFDETYAQAFGVPAGGAGRPPREPVNLDRPRGINFMRFPHTW